jgi:hypothetical protein
LFIQFSADGAQSPISLPFDFLGLVRAHLRRTAARFLKKRFVVNRVQL